MRTYRFVGAVILVFAVASVAVFFALPMGRDGVRDAEADQAAASVTERFYGVSMQLERAQKESTAQFEHLSEKLQRLLDTQSHDVPNPGAAELAAPAHDAPDKQPGSVCANETARVTADRIDGLTPEAIRRSVGNRGNAQRVLRLMDKLRRGERVTVVAAGGSITLGHGLWSEGHSKFNPNFQAWPGQLLAWMQACQRAHMHARKDAHAHGRTPACTHKHTYTHTLTHTHTQAHTHTHAHTLTHTHTHTCRGGERDTHGHKSRHRRYHVQKYYPPKGADVGPLTPETHHRLSNIAVNGANMCYRARRRTVPPVMHDIYQCIYLCIYVCIYLSMYLCIYLSIYVSIYLYI